MATQKSREGSFKGPKKMGRGPGIAFPEAKPDHFKETMGKLIAYLNGYVLALIFVIIFAAASSIFNILGPGILAKATDLLYEGAKNVVAGTGSVDFLGISDVMRTLAIIYLASFVFGAARGWLMATITQRIAYKMRKDVVDKINRLPISYFESRPVGDVLSIITNDVDMFASNLGQSTAQLVSNLATVIGVLVMMFIMSVKMTLIVLVVLPLSALVIFVFYRLSQRYFSAQQDYLGQVDANIEETFAGYEVVTAFNRRSRATQEFSGVNEHLYEAAWKSQFISGLMNPFMNLIGNLAYVAVVVFGAVFMVAGTMTVGGIQAFIQYVRNFTQPLSRMAQVSAALQTTLAAAERVFDFLEAEDQSQPQVPQGVCEPVCGKIRFENVTFGYNPDEPVIRDFSVDVNAGQTIAIVGATGAGKSTLIKLLQRFYDPQEGEILLDDVNIADVMRSDLNNRIAAVTQDTWLFNGSIRENIRYGRRDASDDEVIQAAKIARADHFIRTQADGYDLMIDEEGSNISAGQKQLLTIARAVLADRPILILDEATSNVDTQTEKRIQEGMDKLMEGRTSFVIAHRLSTIENSDRILVVDQGNIVESGTHDELLDFGGIYAGLYNSQFAQ